MNDEEWCIETVEDVIESHKNRRWYKKPFAMEVSDWDELDEFFKTKYPYQFWLRHAISDLLSRLKGWADWPYDTYRWLFKPCNPILRKGAYIHRRWCDLDYYIIHNNFAIIEQFVDEMSHGCVDWDHDEKSREFKAWIEEAYKYIKTGRDALLLDQDRSVTCEGHTSMAEMMKKDFTEYRRLEKVVEATDTKILTQMIQYRGYFWT